MAGLLEAFEQFQRDGLKVLLLYDASWTTEVGWYQVVLQNQSLLSF
ncbi:MAG: hypothetical protein ACKVHN_01000 [Candidatus Poseidoniales archaeon]|jgi:hypothetical protein